MFPYVYLSICTAPYTSGLPSSNHYVYTALSGPLVPFSNVTLRSVASLIWRGSISSYFSPISPLFYFLNLCSLQMIFLRLRLQPDMHSGWHLFCFAKTFEIFPFQAQPRLNLRGQKGICYLPKAIPPFSVIVSSNQPGKSGQPVLLGRWESRPATGIWLTSGGQWGIKDALGRGRSYVRTIFWTKHSENSDGLHSNVWGSDHALPSRVRCTVIKDLAEQAIPWDTVMQKWELSSE